MKTMKKLTALFLALVLLLGLMLPVGAATTPKQAAAAQARKLLNPTKDAFSNSFVYPYASTFDVSVVKGGNTLMKFRRNTRSPRSDDLFSVDIYRGDLDEFFSSEEPELIEYKEYSMTAFDNGIQSLACTFSANEKYSVGEYTGLCYVTSKDYSDMYTYQLVYLISIHVLSGNVPAKSLGLCTMIDGSAEMAYTDQLSYGETVVLCPYLEPFANTTVEDYKVTSSNPKVITADISADYVNVKAVGIGYATLTVSCGNLSKSIYYTVKGLNSFSVSGGKTNLCVGMTDTAKLSYSPSNVPLDLSWSSSNPAVAKVSNGVITAVAPGTAEITAKAGIYHSTITYTVHQHELAEGATVTERTATMPKARMGHCTLCDSDAMIVLEPAIFTDTAYNAWYAPHVDFVYENKIMNGMSDNTFAPNRAMTRAMVATVLYRLAGEPELSGELPTESPFTDVSLSQWYGDAVLWAQSIGVIKGYDDGTFRPNNNITREQFATILYRYTETTGAEMKEGASLSTFPDSAKVQSYAKDAMQWAIAEGLITGIASGGVTTLAPQNNTTRAQFATIVSRYIEAFPKTESPDPLESEITE